MNFRGLHFDSGTRKIFQNHFDFRALKVTMTVEVEPPILDAVILRFGNFKKNQSFGQEPLSDKVAKRHKKVLNKTKTKEHYKYFVKFKFSEFLKINFFSCQDEKNHSTFC